MAAYEFPELMMPAEASEALRVGVKTLQRWAAAGRIRSVQTPGITGPGHRRYFRAEIEALIAGEPLTDAEFNALVRGEEASHDA